MATELFIKYHGFNPYHVSVNGKTYEIKNIVFYKEDGTLIEVGQGWFGDNNRFPILIIPDVIHRRVQKFDGKTFIISQKRDWLDRNDPHPHAVIYIPLEYFVFEVTTREENHGYYTDVFPVYRSTLTPGLGFVHYKGRTRVENSIIKARAKSILGAINAVERELERLKREYSECDQYGRLSEEMKDTPIIDHGVASQMREITKRVLNQK